MLFRRPSELRSQLNTFGYATWRSYSKMSKKAVEQEFTWGGFVISLSIAFLFIGFSSSGLNAIYERSVERNTQKTENHELLMKRSPSSYHELMLSC